MAQEEFLSIHDPAELVGYAPAAETWADPSLVVLPDDHSLVILPDEPLITLPSFGGSLLGRAAKRGMDLLASAIGLAVVLPIIALISIAIVIESPGSPLFVHRRLGRWGREFGMVKFRTMVPRAEERLRELLDQHPELRREWESLHKVKDDPRITRVGRFLRKYSLDELPQLANVLLGHMSLVGPRPIVRDELERFGDRIPLVQSVRPGLTGLWVVNGRTDTAYEERVDLECSYVREWSPALDLRILLMTIPKVVRGSGAY